MSSSSISLLRAVAVIFVLPLVAACDDHAVSATAKPERPVQVERVAFENENATREFVGVVRARYETDLGFRVAGKIVSRVVNVGGEWFYEEYARGSGVSSVGLEEKAPTAPSEEERNSILDLFRNKPR